MKQIESLEDLKLAFEEQTSVPFKIVGISNKGFYARILDFKAFVPLGNMPFFYKSAEAWQCMLPFLKHTLFFAKIQKIDTEGEYFFLNADIPQFKKVELQRETNYQGVIVEKTDKFLIIEIGHSFGWKYGSVKGILHRTMRDSLCKFGILNVGDQMTAQVHVVSSNADNHIFKGCVDFEEWNNGEIHSMLNAKVSVQLVLVGPKRVYIVNGKHHGNLLKNFDDYKKSKYRYAIKSMIKDLKDGQKIQAQVTRVREENKSLDVRWIFKDEDIDQDFEATRNTIGNIFNFPSDFLDEEE